MSDELKILVGKLQAENARLTEEAEALKGQVESAVNRAEELKAFVMGAIYPALESQTAMNIAALEALSRKVGVDDSQADESPETEGE